MKITHIQFYKMKTEADEWLRATHIRKTLEEKEAYRNATQNTL